MLSKVIRAQEGISTSQTCSLTTKAGLERGIPEHLCIGILTSGVDSLGMVMYVAAPETIMNIKIPTNTLALDRAKSIIFI